MEGRELDPYEQQLLAVFESCDQDQSGSLDGHGLEQLCEKLQLEEQGFQLMKCLLGNTASNKRVTFPEFRDGLLALLGEDQGERPERREIGDRGSPEREVSPKFVFGKKKYGRRSRPESTEQDLTLEQDENLEDSDLEIFVPVEDKTKEITMRSVPVASSIEDEVTKKRKTGNSPTDRKASSLPSAQNSEMSQVNFPSWQTSAVCSDSATPSLGENEEECLRAAWERLGVGKDGFLDRGELALVCECIGMEKVAEEDTILKSNWLEDLKNKVVQQLFEKLDVDRDGRISFEEFLLLFRSGGSWVQSSAASQSRTGGKTAAGRIGSNFQQHSEKNKERQALGSSSDQDSQFLSLDPNNAGFVNAELIVEIWEAAGIPGPSRLLQDLGYNESQRLNIADLAAILEEELRSLAEERRNEDAAGARVHSYSPHETLLQATLALYQTEVRCLKLSLEHMSGERDKLRADIMDANQRASLLAQEIDDHHARLEKSSQLQVKLLEQRHAEQLKDLSEQLGSDREQLASQNLSLEKQVESLQEEESRLRTQVSTLQTENEVLEKENQNLTEQLSKSEESKVQLQQELESLAGLQQRLSELEGSHEQEQVLPLLEKLNELQAENTGLRDRNDELTMEVEALSAKLASLKTKKSPVIQPSYDLVDAGASEGSGVPSGGSATKRRGNSPLVLTTEDSSEEESPRLGKMRRCCDGGSGDSQDLSLEAVNMEGLQIHPLGHGESGVETDLEIDDFAESSFKGEEKLKNHHCSDWATNEMLPSLSQREEESEVIANLKAHIAKLEQELKLKSEKLVVCETERSRLKENLYKNPHSVAVAEADKPKSAKQLKGQLKQEYEKCEDYWANKLEEERHLYDQEQKFSDEKYAELMSKIREYEEMFGAQEDDRSEDSDRLSTIEERASLEKQFTDLEEEFEEFKMRTEAEQAEKEEELSKLREQISAMEQVNKHTENKLNVAVQVSDLENGSWESDRTFVVELDGARKAIQHERDSLRIGKTPERAAGLLNGYNSMRSKILPGSRSSSPQSGPSTYSDNAELRAELIRLRNLKEQLDEECQVLRQQKEDLVQDVLDIQTGKPHHQNGGVGMPFSFPPHWTAGAKAGGQACRIDLNILQALNARLRQQEQQCRHLQQALKQQQQQSESILKRTWQKHKEEVSTLQSLLQTTQEKLNQQTSACKEQMERLARTDVLVKDLYVENAYLVATVQRLEQHCHVLVQMTSDSSSV
ncbi:ninein homolog isoform X3 [Periplaneta americana]|uniref:ninein homolog isoform X3 n=1 Tax=Periplaneta americana TaxID=6978 RepID=UPI0037E8F0B9